MEIVDDLANDGATVETLIEAVPEDYQHSFIAVADKIAVSQPGYPVIIVALFEKRGQSFDCKHGI